MTRRNKGPLYLQEILKYRKEVSDNRAWLFVQGYPFTGFLVVEPEAESGVLRKPPGVTCSFEDLSLFWDLRLFGEKGEWHLWREDDGEWSGRFLARGECSPHIERKDVLWGLPAEKKGTSEREEGTRDGVVWTRFTEDRGAAFWIPGQRLKKEPARLRLWQKIEEDGAGLAGVVDVMLCELVTAEEARAQ
jgi:CRISPR-associated protein (TIGR03984 family)